MIHQLHVLLLAAFAVVLTLGLVSGYLKNRTAVSEPFLAIAAGVAIGPFGAGLVELSRLGPPHLVLQTVALFTISLSVLEAALRVPNAWLRRGWPTPLVLVGLVMPLVWLLGAGFSAVILGLGLWPALLLGAILAPTDPVMSQSVLDSAPARRNVPANLRHALTVESGCNDGLALPLVALPLLMLEALEAPVRHFLLDVLLLEVAGGLLAGLGLGLVIGRVNLWACREHLEASDAQGLITPALAVIAAAGGVVFGFSGIIAAFVAGLAFAAVSSHEVTAAQERFDASIKRALELPVFVCLGIYLPLDAWGERPLALTGLALALLVLRRPLPLLALRSLLPGVGSRHQALYLGWFGPVGLAALYYAAEAQARLGESLYLEITSFMILASALIHGSTAEPVARHLPLRR